MSLHNPPRPREERPWRAVREEVWELASLVAIVAALSVGAVMLAVILAGV